MNTNVTVWENAVFSIIPRGSIVLRTLHAIMENVGQIKDVVQEIQYVRMHVPSLRRSLDAMV